MLLMSGARRLSAVLTLFVSLALTQITAADFGKLDTSWHRLTPKRGSEKWNLGSEGFLTYTADSGYPHLPVRHSYSWFHMYGNYQVVSGYSINGLLTIQKTTLSNNLNESPFQVSAFPQISFEGTLAQMFPFEDLPDSGHTIRIQAGTLPMFQHGQGLFYSQFTGLGYQMQADFKYLQLEMAYLGNGYYEGDDLQSLYLYGPHRWFGIGALSEINTVLGNRVVPGIAGEFLPIEQLRLYYEGGISIFYAPTGLKRYDTGYYYDSVPLTLDLSNVSLRPGFEANNRTLAGLVGLDFSWKKILPAVERLLFSNQVRYYGADVTDFYEKQRRSHFYYFTDVTTDLRYNNQPYNFYLYPGRSLGIYMLQEVDLLPLRAIRVALRNELLLIYYENGYSTLGYNPVRSGNDLLGITVNAVLDEKLFFGLKISNVLIGDMEYGSAEYLYYQRAPLLLETAKYWLVDFHIRYRI